MSLRSTPKLVNDLCSSANELEYMQDKEIGLLNEQQFRVDCLKPFSVWKHFKGSTVIVIALAGHSETGERLVVYKCLSNNGIYARPLEMFLSEVDKEKYPDCEQKYRFEFIGI